MYVNYEEIQSNIAFPKGSAIAVLGEERDKIEDKICGYKTTESIDESTRFVCIGQGKDCALNAYGSTERKLPFALFGSRPEKVFLDDVLWIESQPFSAKISEPRFIARGEKNDKEDLEFCVRLAFALGEKITQEVLFYGEAKTCFPSAFQSVDFITSNLEEVYSLAFSLNGQVDGLKQTESALTLLKTKEKNVFNRYDSVVLLAKNLAKVYNYFISYKPTSLFAPDNNGRAEMIEEFLGVKNPRLRGIASEFEIRRRYYMLEHNQEFLSYLWERIYALIRECFRRHRIRTENNGFCLEEISEDAKFSAFLAPDVLNGDTLLSFIKDCGIADLFI
jgi:hypothetical protein